MRYFKFVGDPDNYKVYQEGMDDKEDYKFLNPFMFKPEKGETYKGNAIFYFEHQESLHDTYLYDSITLASFLEKYRPSSLTELYNDDWVDVTNKLLDEEAFINQCAIEAMKAFISPPERLPEALDLVNIPALAFNVAEEMNEERKKRLKKSSS